MTTATALHRLALDAARAGSAAILATLHRDGGPPSDPVAQKASHARAPVTAADLASDRAIRALVTARRPDDGWLTEESPPCPGGSGLRWLVDPLDGTVNLLRGSDRFAVSVAAQADGTGVVAAAVVRPATGDWLSLAPHGITGSARIGVSVVEPAQALVGFAVPSNGRVRRAGYRALAGVAAEVLDLRNHGSTVCDLAAVAVGALDGFITIDPAPWDLAAGIRLVHAAGGTSRRWRRPDGIEIVVAGGPALVTALGGWLDG